jgi:hypothetical protein
MSDVLNCDGMTAEQARAALRAHCRAQEAAANAERGKRAEHRRANAERLGWVIGQPPVRPKKFPVRVGQRPEIRFNGRRALVARWQDAFIGFDSGHPVKRLTFEIVAGRYDCFRVTAILEDEDLTPDTYWLSGCDVLEVTGGAIRFCSGFELAARNGAAAFSIHAIPEPEVAAARHLLKAVAALESGGGAAVLPGWRLNKLSLKACPNGKRPGVFAYGRVVYTVPGGDAWEAVCRLIEAGAFDGHGLPMKTPGDLFRREHRAFFNERMAKNGSGWFLRTL